MSNPGELSEVVHTTLAQLLQTTSTAAAAAGDGMNPATTTTADRDAATALLSAAPDGGMLNASIGCSGEIPRTQELFRAINEHVPWAYWFVVFGLVMSLLTIVIFVEEMIFINKRFQIQSRKWPTIWLLSLVPVYSFTSFVACIIPRAGTLIDLVSNVYFASAIYNFGVLCATYFGGEDNMFKVIGSRKVIYHTPPCCCCCRCLPKEPFDKTRYNRLKMVVIQICIIRPIFMFLGAALWANGDYLPGVLAAHNLYVYITIINLATTLTSMYGLFVLSRVFVQALEKFQINGKMMLIQLVLLSGPIPNMLFNILVTSGVIGCTIVLPSKARGEVIYHYFLIVVMIPIGLLARRAYRREQDGRMWADDGFEDDIKGKSGSLDGTIAVPLHDVEVVDSQPHAKVPLATEEIYLKGEEDNTNNNNSRVNKGASATPARRHQGGEKSGRHLEPSVGLVDDHDVTIQIEDKTKVTASEPVMALGPV